MKFVWHPDEDDVYDGNVFGNTVLDDRPCTAFYKEIGKSFTMNGGDKTLTLAPVVDGMDVFVEWGSSPGPWVSDPAMTHITVNSGTLLLEPTGIGTLMISSVDSVVAVDLKGNLIIHDMNVEGSVLPADPSPRPGATINVYRGGKFIAAPAKSTGGNFGGAFDINVHAQGSMSVTARFVDLTSGGTYTISGPPPAGSASLEMIASPLSPTSDVGDNHTGAFFITNHQIVCNSDSVSLLKATSMSCANAHIKAEDAASVLIACNSIAFDSAISREDAVALYSSTIFAVGQGSPTITFTSSNDGPAPFDFKDQEKQYPKGLFNFITDEGTNRGKFRFLGVGSVFEFFAMLQKGLITVNGEPDDGTKTAWKQESDGGASSKSYFTIYLK